MTKFSVKEIDRGWKRITNIAKSMKQGKSYIKAGIVGEAAEKREHDEGKNAAPTNVDIAFWQEFGTDRIPERSFIRGPFEAHRQDYQQALRIWLKEVLEGRVTIEVALGRVGLQMARDMKRAIETSSGGYQPFVPNAPSTIAKKGSSRPLVDTGVLKNSISHEVVVRGE